MITIDQLPEILYKHRKVAGLSRITLAELAGVGKTVVYNLEKGKESVQLDTLKKILSVLNIQLQLASPLINNIAEDEKS